MQTMQYCITLPNDYDMGIIRKRIQDSGSKTDGFQDLKIKAYLLAEKNKYANYANQYSPFYLWDKTDGMNLFMLGGYFSNIINSFGRPVVKNWIGLYEYIKKTTEPQYAVIQTKPIDESKDISLLLENEKIVFTERVDNPSTTAFVISYNPLTWEICYYYMGTDLSAIQEIAKGSLIYDVYHIS